MRRRLQAGGGVPSAFGLRVSDMAWAGPTLGQTRCAWYWHPAGNRDRFKHVHYGIGDGGATTMLRAAGWVGGVRAIAPVSSAPAPVASDNPEGSQRQQRHCHAPPGAGEP